MNEPRLVFLEMEIDFNTHTAKFLGTPALALELAKFTIGESSLIATIVGESVLGVRFVFLYKERDDFDFDLTNGFIDAVAKPYRDRRRNFIAKPKATR